MLCGDEVGAIVADIGTLHSRFGSAGQDSPKHVFHSAAGYDEALAAPEYHHGLGYLRNIQQNMETEVVSVESPDGSMNYDVVSSIINHGITNCMQVEAANFPLLMVENKFSSKEDKYKLMEMFFEEFNFPATYFPATPMVGAFCHGRTTGLVVDLGASHTTVSPIVDGYVLEKSVMSTARGGNWLDSRIREVLAQENIPLKPWYEKEGFHLQNIRTTPSFRQFHIDEISRDLKHWMCFVSRTAIGKQSGEEIGSHPRVMQLPSYELPDGTLVAASDSICLATELFFSSGRTRGPPAPPAMQKGQTSTSSVSSAVAAASKSSKSGILAAPLMLGVPTYAQKLDIDPSVDPLHELIYASIAKCDPDCRKEMTSNIVLIGGGSLMDGIQPRLATELVELLPAQLKPKISSKLPVEQLYAPWIGGSILGICGTFQQMWLSREEYLENGPVPALAKSRG